MQARGGGILRERTWLCRHTEVAPLRRSVETAIAGALCPRHPQLLRPLRLAMHRGRRGKCPGNNRTLAARML